MANSTLFPSMAKTFFSQIFHEKNHFLIGGLAALKTADPTKMAGESKNYQVTIKHTFVDGLINALTSGLYTPTTTIVKK